MWLHRASLAIGILAMGLTPGCGFHSAYGKKGNVGLDTEFARISIPVIRDRLGQMLRNELQDLMNPKGRARNPAYELRVSLRSRDEKLGIRSTALSTRANLHLTGTFSLTEKGRTGGKEGDRMAGTRTVVAGYNIFASDFATLRAKKDAERRAVREMAREIESQIASFLIGRMTEKGSTAKQ